MHPKLVTALKTAVTLTSGAGHDAMILAQVMPAVMLFIRSPGGVSHHPDETVLVEDIETAYRAGKQFVENWRG
jgi:allantoate deiminase